MGLLNFHQDLQKEIEAEGLLDGAWRLAFLQVNGTRKETEIDEELLEP
jgi:hypothetical protein